VSYCPVDNISFFSLRQAVKKPTILSSKGVLPANSAQNDELGRNFAKKRDLRKDSSNFRIQATASGDGSRLTKFDPMSRAFIKEGDDQWLSDIAPTLNALVHYLTRQNNGVKVYLKHESADANGRSRYEMSDGLTYRVDETGKWTAD
jgi:hypothetical protein